MSCYQRATSPMTSHINTQNKPENRFFDNEQMDEKPSAVDE